MRVAKSYFDDDDDSSPLDIYLGKHQYIQDEVNVVLDGVPLLRNRTTNEILLPIKTKAAIDYFLQQAREKGETGILLSPKSLGSKRYPYCEKFEFKYSQIDYEYIPGLIRPWDDGFLTPCFFNIAVLNKYTQNPKYRLDLFSETYGTIYSDDFYISFGINRRKLVIMWLGDIDSLPDEEKHYLRSENIESDHDIHSEFYEAQIDVQYSDMSKQNELFHLRKSLNDKFHKQHGEGIFSLDGEVASVISNLTRPIFWEEKHVGPVIESFNRIFVESVNSKFLKKIIIDKDKSKDIKSAGSLKTLQAWLEVVLSESSHSDILLPFYVLYDFRVFSSHLLPNEKRSEMLKSINIRLALDSDNFNLELIYDTLIEKLSTSIGKIDDLLQ